MICWPSSHRLEASLSGPLEVGVGLWLKLQFRQATLMLLALRLSKYNKVSPGQHKSAFAANEPDWLPSFIAEPTYRTTQYSWASDGKVQF